MNYQYYYVEIINLYFHELLCCERCYIRPEIVIMIPCSERIEFTFEIKISHQNSNALPHCGGEHKNFGESKKSEISFALPHCGGEHSPPLRISLRTALTYT